ncbi:hypothetical protein BpHYR1_001365 [Brachionus plicatilis]|uniref:Uncharacterized protein n=1 Tax=Brachionus plicatilis TaxID=10195 RepID=A0A3M7SK27_BRAPC|nr:hypothetical protein BpHYR1_001365 [Brachionus plicatilis]
MTWFKSAVFDTNLKSEISKSNFNDFKSDRQRNEDHQINLEKNSFKTFFRDNCSQSPNHFQQLGDNFFVKFGSKRECLAEINRITISRD